LPPGGKRQSNAHGQNFYNQGGGTFQGDPFMALVPPLEQFLGSYTVTTPAEEAIPVGERFDRNYINLVAPGAAVGQIEVDGVAVAADQFTPIGSSGFFGAQVPVELGSHELAGPLPFGAMVYGFGGFDSYGYIAGQSLALIATVAAVEVTPATAMQPVGSEITVTARALDSSGQGVEGVRLDFDVSGVNAQQGFAFTDATGTVQFSYVGGETGRDVVTASLGEILDDAIIDWQSPAAPPTILINSPPDGTALAAGTTGRGAARRGLSLTVLPPRSSAKPVAPVALLRSSSVRMAQRGNSSITPWGWSPALPTNSARFCSLSTTLWAGRRTPSGRTDKSRWLHTTAHSWSGARTA